MSGNQYRGGGYYQPDPLLAYYETLSDLRERVAHLESASERSREDRYLLTSRVNWAIGQIGVIQQERAAEKAVAITPIITPPAAPSLPPVPLWLVHFRAMDMKDLAKIIIAAGLFVGVASNTINIAHLKTLFGL